MESLPDLQPLKTRRPVTTLALTLVAALGLTGCSSTTLTGSLMLRNAFGEGSQMEAGRYPCVGAGGYSDIGEGTSVTVYDATGAIVATGKLGTGKALAGAGTCLFPFQVAGVPGSDFYQVEVSHRGRVNFTAEQVANNEVSLVLGSRA